MKNLMFLLLLLFCTCFGFSNCSPTNLCKSATKLAYPVYGIVDPNLTNNIDLYFRLCKKYNSYFALMLACLVQPRYTCSKSLIDQNLCNNQTALEYPLYASNTVPALQKKMNKKNCKIYTDSNSLAAACKSKPKYSCSIPAQTTKSGKKTTTTPVSCRRIKNAVSPHVSPLNLVSVGTLENGTIVCKVAFQDIGLLKLSPKIGMITFLDKPKEDFFLAKSGIFYWNQHIPYDYLSNAYKYCPNNWELANAITPTLKDELDTFMTANGISGIVVNANCSTSATAAYWNDGTPFNYTLDKTYNGPWVLYNNHASGNERFYCGNNWHNYVHVVCMVKIYSYPWTEF